MADGSYIYWSDKAQLRHAKSKWQEIHLKIHFCDNFMLMKSFIAVSAESAQPFGPLGTNFTFPPLLSTPKVKQT